MTNSVGDKPDWVDLEIRKGSDCDFDVEWYEEDGVTLIPLISTAGAVKDKYDGDQLVDLASGAGHVTIVGGIAQVRMGAVFTATLDALERGQWAFTGSSATDTRTLLEGNVRIRENV